MDNIDDEAMAESQPAPAPVPWYSLNPKHLRLGRITQIVILVAGVVALSQMVSVKPLWQWGWRVPLYCWQQLQPITGASGRKYPGGGWTHGRRILVYGAPGVKGRAVREAAGGLRDLIDELGLDMHVEETTPPADALRDLATVVGKGNAGFDFDRFRDLRLDSRGEQYAEMVVVHQSFTDPTWAWGLSEYTPGLSVLQENMAGNELGKHEGAHLLGYFYHDDRPWEILGYHENWYPTGRDTLMMLMATTNHDLSDRARDALLNFWRGKEDREHERYFRAK